MKRTLGPSPRVHAGPGAGNPKATSGSHGKISLHRCSFLVSLQILDNPHSLTSCALLNHCTAQMTVDWLLAAKGDLVGKKLRPRQIHQIHLDLKWGISILFCKGRIPGICIAPLPELRIWWRALLAIQFRPSDYGSPVHGRSSLWILEEREHQGTSPADDQPHPRFTVSLWMRVYLHGSLIPTR